MLIKNKKEQEIFKQAYEEEKNKQLELIKEIRIKQIQDKAKDKAYRKYGMTRRDKIAYYIQKFNKGVAKARKEIEVLQNDLENDLNNERYY